jgi:hypothetical protein
MNINDYSTKVKNPIDDEDLVAITLNGLGKYYSQFCTSIVVRKTFPDFQNLITLFISEEMRIDGTSSNGGSQESVFYSNTNRGRGRGRGGKISFRGRHRSSHGGHHQHESQFHGGGRGNFGGRGSQGSHRD